MSKRLAVSLRFDLVRLGAGPAGESFDDTVYASRSVMSARSIRQVMLSSGKGGRKRVADLPHENAALSAAFSESMVPEKRLELPTRALRMRCSTN
jgi:hypothetical protein